jgi:hypothetical protein
MKLKFLVTAGLLWAAGTAWGQVAAPPLTPGTFALENPAAIKWGAPSRVGILAGTGTFKDNQGSPEFKFTGYSLGLRLVGNMFAVAAEASQLNSDDVVVAPITAHARFSSQDVQVAVQLGQSVALGVGQRTETTRLEYSSPFPPTTSGTSVESVTPVAGVSLRLGEYFFLGAAAGQEERTVTDLITNAGVAAKRDVTKAGVGLRTGSTVLFHAEGYAIDKANFSTTAGPQDGEQRTGATVEVIAGNVLLGYNAEHTTFKHSTDSNDTRDSQFVAVGWAPRMGLSVAVHLREEKTFHLVTAPNPRKIDTFASQVLALTYLW